MMDPIIITAIAASVTACIAAPYTAISILWKFVMTRFDLLEKANKLCEDRNKGLERRLLLLESK